jgi:hypothetical protein
VSRWPTPVGLALPSASRTTHQLAGAVSESGGRRALVENHTELTADAVFQRRASSN